MSTLIVIGNINEHTFANSVVAANEKSKDIFEKKSLENIHVFHTKKSFETLLAESNKWIKFLEKHGIYAEQFIHRTLDIDSEKDNTKFLEKFARNIEEIVDMNKDIIIDISNGPTFQKNLLSVIAYILNLKHQYILDIVELSKHTKERGFINTEILKKAYMQAPESKKLDALAYLDLSEVKRYNDKIMKLSENFKNVSPGKADIEFFRDNLTHSINFKLQGDKNSSNALYRISSSSIASSAEELIGLILDSKNSSNHHQKTLGAKLNLLYEIIEKEQHDDIDTDFVKKFNDFVLFLRNTTVHKSSKKKLSDTEKFKAELSITTTLAFIEFYSDVIYPKLQKSNINNSYINGIKYNKEPNINEEYYFGIDGDNTGAFLENMLIKNDKKQLREISKNITTALNKIENFIKKISRNNEVIFKTGDDMLVKGTLSIENLEKIQDIYNNTTPNLTCSIGFGKTSKDAYIALKLAKANPEKNSIRGIILK
ncbi:MAG TPA: mCpol domain-containing protein [Epsilonproteobacteria bacterium]|nr:mCpol domain-containing protein [Campylobacterota bacterium]